VYSQDLLAEMTFQTQKDAAFIFHVATDDTYDVTRWEAGIKDRCLYIAKVFGGIHSVTASASAVGYNDDDEITLTLESHRDLFAYGGMMAGCGRLAIHNLRGLEHQCRRSGGRTVHIPWLYHYPGRARNRFLIPERN